MITKIMMSLDVDNVMKCMMSRRNGFNVTHVNYGFMLGVLN